MTQEPSAHDSADELNEHSTSRSPRRWTLLALAAIGLSALWTAFGILPDARYAWSNKAPIALGELKTASSLQPGWVSARGEPAEEALSFERRWVDGSFRLTRVTAQEEVWLMLQVPEGIESYVPPASFSGQLLRLDAAKGTLAPVAKLLEAKGSGDSAWLLVDGKTPTRERPAIFAFAGLLLLGFGCLAVALLLSRPAEG